MQQSRTMTPVRNDSDCSHVLMLRPMRKKNSFIRQMD